MSARATALAALLACTFLALPATSFAGAFEAAVLAEINEVRADPQAYARELRRVRVRFDGYSATHEDPDAVEDAIAFLERQPALPPLGHDLRLSAAARSHADRQSASGEVGHGPPGSLSKRLQAEGLWAGLLAEGISYGQATPRDVVRQLVIDSHVPNRGHRKDIFGRAYQAAGVACGPHARWGAMCVIDYAGAIVER